MVPKFLNEILPPLIEIENGKSDMQPRYRRSDLLKGILDDPIEFTSAIKSIRQRAQEDGGDY